MRNHQLKGETLGKVAVLTPVGRADEQVQPIPLADLKPLRLNLFPLGSTLFSCSPVILRSLPKGPDGIAAP